MNVDLPRIAALTVRRPWAYCITGLSPLVSKDVENRTWVTKQRGDILLHAGQGWDSPAVQAARRSLHHAGGILDDIPASPDQHPTGFVALVRLAGICSESAHSPSVVCGCGPWAMPGQHHWRLEHVRPFIDPVPWPGAQGLWWPPQPALERVVEQCDRLPSRTAA